MGLRKLAIELSRGHDGPSLAHSRMADEEDVEVWVQRGRGLQKDLLLKRRADDANRGPLAEDRCGFEVGGIVNVAFDPGGQPSLACAVYHWACSLGAHPDSFQNNRPC